jgi:NADPH-dependent ferric siderophore reductase
MSAAGARLRREPPTFRAVAVERCELLGARMIRITLGGPEFVGFAVPDVAASVRVLLPREGERAVVVPRWNGNEFLLADGSRPAIRTLTPLRVDSAHGRLDVEVVLHDGGRASAWARTARPGDEVALSGPGRGYAIDPEARRFLIGGDETALPALGKLVDALSPSVTTDILVEIAHADARRADAIPRPAAWHLRDPAAPPGSALAEAIRTTSIGPGDRVWIAGEAAGVQAIRRYLFEEAGIVRARTAVRGYWKFGRAGDTDQEA